MTREPATFNKIALLATGDEISNGDILNTNSQEIARRLFNLGMHPGTHMTTPDTIVEIEQAIHFLLKSHRSLIVTGGLGPTSDDLTRFALSNATNRPLTFDEPTWQTITARLKHFGYHTPPESNRHQALFPHGATIIPNPNGTAAGCMLQHNDQLIFMLPGPPMECLPMLKKVVIPELRRANFQQIEYHKNWLLFGVSEGQIAEELDAIAKPYDCVTGYRLAYPYIEFKLHSNYQRDFETLVPLIEQTIKPYIIGNGTQLASEQLCTVLENRTTPLEICDYATGGLLETLLRTPKTSHHLRFTSNLSQSEHIVITGLDTFWQGDTTLTHTSLNLEWNLNGKKNSLVSDIPYRGERVKFYAAEFICWKIFELFKTN